MVVGVAAMAGRYVSQVTADDEMLARVPAVFTLLGCGCCELCALRYLGHRSFSLYREPLPVLRAMMESLWKLLSDDVRSKLAEDWRARSAATETGTCTACLGSLQNARSDSFMEPLLQKLKEGMTQYEHMDYSLTITLPAATISRHYAIHCHLLDVHPDIAELKEWDYIVDIKEAMKWILGHELRRILNLKFSRTALFHAAIKFKHQETDNEHEVLYQIPEANLRQRKQRKGGKEESEETSITAVSKALRTLPRNIFRKYGNIPPKPVQHAATCELTFFHDSIYISGRYAKFSRELSQSPWTVGDTRVSETSVQELITGPIKKYFLAQEMRFSSSGREDIDVRMLGEGRPFVLEIINPHRTKYTPNDYANMQREINDATHLVRVRDLQRVNKEDITQIQEGIEDKRKSYRCVVWLAKAITPSDLEPLAKIKGLVIDQTTPIRVLHRRTLCVRKRTIYSMRAQYASPHFITLDLTTQSGTYVKEFIHGDLGRTRPNLGSLMGCETDILQLDVLAIDLAFPPRLPGQPPVLQLATDTIPENDDAATAVVEVKKAESSS